ncbi:MAG: outer membrane lipoprotein carrier protein LolA [Bacteroidota bacterium]|nr:outer membrane lipoprotein carrier protein LolA [Bacteroidota bacterium]
MIRFALLLFVFPLLSFGQEQTAKIILDKLSQKTSSYSSIEAHFTNVFYSEIAQVNESQKGIIYVKGNAFKLKTDDQLIISDGESTWIYLIEENEVNISDGNEDETLNPSSLFTIYENGYKYKYVSDDGKYHNINLFPTKNGPFSKVEMKIHKSKMEISSFTMIDKQGSQYTYVIDKFLTNKSFSEDFFKFSLAKYPGVDVIDLR